MDIPAGNTTIKLSKKRLYSKSDEYFLKKHSEYHGKEHLEQMGKEYNKPVKNFMTGEDLEIRPLSQPYTALNSHYKTVGRYKIPFEDDPRALDAFDKEQDMELDVANETFEENKAEEGLLGSGGNKEDLRELREDVREGKKNLVEDIDLINTNLKY